MLLRNIIRHLTSGYRGIALTCFIDCIRIMAYSGARGVNMAKIKDHVFLCKLFGIDEKKALEYNLDIDFPFRRLGSLYHSRKYMHDLDDLNLTAWLLDGDVETKLKVWILHKILDEDKNLESVVRWLRLMRKR